MCIVAVAEYSVGLVVGCHYHEALIFSVIEHEETLSTVKGFAGVGKSKVGRSLLRTAWR